MVFSRYWLLHKRFVEDFTIDLQNIIRFVEHRL